MPRCCHRTSAGSSCRARRAQRLLHLQQRGHCCRPRQGRVGTPQVKVLTVLCIKKLYIYNSLLMKIIFLKCPGDEAHRYQSSVAAFLCFRGLTPDLWYLQMLLPSMLYFVLIKLCRLKNMFIFSSCAWSGYLLLTGIFTMVTAFSTCSKTTLVFCTFHCTFTRAPPSSLTLLTQTLTKWASVKGKASTSTFPGKR